MPDLPERPAPAAGRDVVAHTAALARLDLDDADLDRLAADFERILGAFRDLAEIPDDELPGAVTSGATSRLRDGSPRDENDGGLAARLLANAPDREDDFFAVPKTLDASGGTPDASGRDR